MNEELDLERLVDEQRIGWHSIVFLIVATAVLVSDGFDLSAMGYLAPELAKQWGLNASAFVPTFSAGIIGMMIGGPLMGSLGDRLGRKRLVVWGLVAIGVFTLMTMGIRSTSDLVVLRFLTGVGLGGVIPNIGALVAELSPQRVRGRMLVILALGVPIGIALPGLVAATLVPHFGWRGIMLAGGVLPLLVAVVAMFALPESVKYLVRGGQLNDEIRAVIERIRPDLEIGPDAKISAPSATTSSGSLAMLFAGDFSIVTPILWLCQAANQMANFFALTWLPTLLQAGGATTAHAGANASLFSLGGLLTGLMLLLVLDRIGIIPIVLLFLCGAPLVAMIALPDLPPGGHALVIFGAGACVTGIQVGLTALLGIFYPTAIRSTGAGWTQAAGRVGGLAAPLVGGLLLALEVPMSSLPLAPAALMVVGTIACASLATISFRRFRSWRPGEFSANRAEHGVADGPRG